MSNHNFDASQLSKINPGIVGTEDDLVYWKRTIYQLILWTYQRDFGVFLSIFS
jgi:hypothetical protein